MFMRLAQVRANYTNGLTKCAVKEDKPQIIGSTHDGRVLKPINFLQPSDKLTHKCNIWQVNKWLAWSLSSNFSVANNSVQKQFFCSIVNPVVMNAIEPEN